MRTDREFNLLCAAAAHNEFAAGAMSLMHSLSRRFWYIHYKQAADMPLTAKLHADIARAIAAGRRRATPRRRATGCSTSSRSSPATPEHDVKHNAVAHLEAQAATGPHRRRSS